MEQKINPRSLNTYNDFEQLSMGIPTVDEFIKKYGIAVYNKFLRLRLKGKIPKDAKFPITDYGTTRVVHNETLDEIKNIINDNKINSATELQDYDRKLYSYCQSKGFLSQITFPNPKQLDTSTINSLEELKNYMLEHNIFTKDGLRRDRPGLYYKFKPELDNIEFLSSQRLSSKEIQFVKELFKYNINFIYQFGIPNSKFKYDFFLKDLNVIIEVHGRQHFDDSISSSAWNVNYSVLDRDKEKKILLDNLQIPVYYFTYDKFYYDKFGYFCKVYTDIQELFSDIGIPMTNIGSSWEEKFKKFTNFSSAADEAKLEVNEYIKKNKIGSLFELKNSNQHLFWLVEKYNLKDNLNFSSIYTIDEINNIILENKLSRYREIFLKFRKVYRAIKDNNWENEIVLYKD